MLHPLAASTAAPRAFHTQLQQRTVAPTLTPQRALHQSR